MAHKDRGGADAPEGETKTQKRIRETKEAYAQRKNKTMGKKD